MAKIGRNSPCSCGSGKKYKKCCQDSGNERILQHSQSANLAEVIPIEAAGGFDFGILPNAMAVGIYDFPTQLSEANIVGVAYGQAWCEELYSMVPMVSLVAQNREPLIRAFSTFSAWNEASDADALEMTFVFRKSGGYVLCLTPEASHLERRCLGFDRAHRAMYSLVTWFKPIDSVQPFLRELAKYKDDQISPFVLVGAHYPGKVMSFDSAPGIINLPEIRPLLKFEATFIEEEDVIPGTIAELAIDRPTRMASGSAKMEDPALSHAAISDRRASTLRVHFPVTLERLRVSSDAARVAAELCSEGLAPWQIEQAMCNLVLSHDMGLGPTFDGLVSANIAEEVTKTLEQRYEIADGGRIPAFGIDEVRAQILADSGMLLYRIGKPIPSDPLAVQSALRLAYLIEAPTAVTDLASVWTKAV